MKKRIISFIFLLFLLVSCSKNNYFDNYTDCSDYLFFKLLENDTYEVNGFSKNFHGENLYIPENYNGKKVTSISNDFFTYYFKNKVNVLIPDSVEYVYSKLPISNNCNVIFEDPSTLKYDGLINEFIDYDKFLELKLLPIDNYYYGNRTYNFNDKCISYYDNGVYLGSKFNRFKCLISLKDSLNRQIKIHKNVEYISPYILQFYNLKFDCSESKKFKVIDGNLYSKDGKKLIYVNPNFREKFDISGVEEICDTAFRISNIDELIIGNSLKYIHPNAFKNVSFGKISIDQNSNFTLKNGSLYSSDYKTLYKYINNDSKIFSDDSVETINNFAFWGSNIEEFYAKNCKSIGDNAFYDSDVKFADISSVTNFGKSVFSYSSINDVIFNENLTNLPEGIFLMCHDLKETIKLPDSLLSIGDFAFSGCKFSKFMVPESVKEIGWRALPSGMDYLYLPETLEYLKGTNLNQLTMEEFHLPKDLKVLYPFTFELCKVRNIYINNSINYIPTYCFAYSSINNVYIPDSINSIGDIFLDLKKEDITLHFESSVIPEDTIPNWNSINASCILSDDYFKEK